MKKWITGIGTLALSGLLAAPLTAQDPYTTPDDTWISVTGTVESIQPDEFALKYDTEGAGWITVEMDDGDRDADAFKLELGDTVTVLGVVDDDLFERRTVEASSVYVRNLGTYFYASSVDDEDAFVRIPEPLMVNSAHVQGTVSAVGETEFMINVGPRQVVVKVNEMVYNPLDDEGTQRVKPGDVVSVYGTLDHNFLEGREILASSIVTIKKR